MINVAAQGVTWIKIEPPQLDVVGLILGSLGLAGALAVVALVLGVALGFALIRRSRRHPDTAWSEDGYLGLTRPGA